MAKAKSKTGSSFEKRLLGELEKIDRPGEFCAAGVAPGVLPGLEVRGLGAIGLPLSEQQAKQLIERSQQAPYGKGEKTLVDTSVRNVWRLTPDQFTLGNPSWAAMVEATTELVAKGLGLEPKSLTPHLYDLLLYEKGSFFLPHRDGEKLDRMVATMVITLPSEHTGGQLLIRHEGTERVIDLSGPQSRYQTHFAGFYADCEHEVKPITSGYRLCLVYNLTLTKAKKPIGAPTHQPHVRAIADLLADWPNVTPLIQIALTLEHEYTLDGLAWDTLKGVDRARASVLADAAAAANCHAYLTLLTYWENGAAEDTEDGYYDRYRYDNEDAEDEDEDSGDDNSGRYVMTDIIDTSLSAEKLIAPDGTIAFKELRIEDQVILPKDSLKDVDPEEEYEGYTGNAGMTLDRWYRRAAILIWPDAHHFDILCNEGVELASAELARLVKASKSKDDKNASLHRDRALLLAHRLLSEWPEIKSYYYWHEERAINHDRDPLASLVALDDLSLIRLYLRKALPIDISLEPDGVLVKALNRFGWPTLESDLSSVFRNTEPAALSRNIRLLGKLCAGAWSLRGTSQESSARDACQRFAQPVVAALASLDTDKKDERGRDGNFRKFPALITGLVQALLSVNAQPLLTQLATHAQAHPSRYGLQTVQIPTLLEACRWAKANMKDHPSPALQQWKAAAERELETLTAQEPQPPKDWRREANVSCKCADCAILKVFLADPATESHSFKMAQHRRRHLESVIASNQIDVSHTTNTRTSPQILICRKNTNSHKRLLEAYRQDLKHLANLRELKL